MKKYLLGLLLALAVSASFAGGVTRVLRVGPDSATLLLDACTLPFLSEEVKKQAGSARIFTGGKNYKGCFIERNGSVMIIDEDEDVYGPFPSSAFEPVKEA